MNVKHENRTSESGNVLFYILIAVALLAALSYAVSQSSRGGANQIGEERARILATEIIDYSNILSKAVTQLKLRGVDLDELCFDSPLWGHTDYNYAGCNDDSNKIFHINGAGVTLKQPEAESQENTVGEKNWRFTGANEINEIGTTCAADSCADLIMRANFIKEEVCIQINNILGVGTKNANPPIDTDISGTEFTGNFSYGRTVADEAGGAAASGQKAACMYQTGDNPKYFFYKVLIAR